MLRRSVTKFAVLVNPDAMIFDVRQRAAESSRRGEFLLLLGLSRCGLNLGYQLDWSLGSS